MRWLVASCSVLVTGCLFPENEIRGRWNVGGDGGCSVGNTIDVSVDLGGGDRYGYDYTCTDREFSIGIPASEENFVVDIEEISRGYVVIARADVELARIRGDFSVGLVHFVPVPPR